MVFEKFPKVSFLTKGSAFRRGIGAHVSIPADGRSFACNVELVREEGRADRDQEGSLNLLSGEMVCNPFILVSRVP